MGIIQFLFLFAYSVYVALSVYIFAKNPRSLMNRTCAAFMFCFVVWSSGPVFVQNPYVPKDIVRLGYKIASFGWVSFPSFFLWFALVFAERVNVLKKKMFYPVIFAFPALLIPKAWTNQLIGDFVKQSYGWSLVWAELLWPYLFYLYFLLFMGAGLYFIYDFGQKQKSITKRKQAKIIFNLTIITGTLGTVTDIVLPEMRIYDVPSVGNVIVVAWAIGLIYTIVRYDFLSIIPGTPADSIISAMVDALVLFNPEGDIVKVNKATCSLLGYSERELVGKGVNILFSRDTIAKFGLQKKTFIDFIRQDYQESYEMVFMTKEGRPVPVLFSVTKMFDRRNRLKGVSGIARDITHIKATEAELRRLNRQLRQNEMAVLNVLTDLKKSHEELKNSQAQLVQSEKLASLGRLVSDMAHEVNNPLMIISGRAHLSLMEESKNEKIKANMEIIKDQCQRAKNIIHRLLLFSKPATGEMKKRNVNDVIRFVTELVEHQYSLINIRIEENYGQALPLLKIDEKQMHEVFMNLLQNSADAMPKGGTIRVTTSEESGRVRIDFSDTGNGILPEHLPKIFDPFFTTRKGGTGLGLSVCYGIIKAHGGDMRYTSEPGKGTTATIILPAEGGHEH